MLPDSARHPARICPLPAALLRRANMMMGMIDNTTTTGMIGTGGRVRACGQHWFIRRFAPAPGRSAQRTLPDSTRSRHHRDTHCTNN